ncbi:6-hydroxynicotinate 3-monooxygenase [Fusarium oxysporum f. sp. raphani]|uniref:6-hydroxynicotinate 3-monooxygenase n=1 Tax=Fusarium oxysporum f. sp. raphani TaxID=96318 RepID=A0A8J5UKF8_FUSOX|nr:6-hydroxynicotinate 3-monooxygenase [Fusarium oxysporum f. sp. raphani]
MKQTKAIIIGGGPAGLATALRLQQQAGVNCTIYELRSAPSTLGSAIGIMPNGLRLLDRLGVYSELKERGSSHSNMTIHSINGGVLGRKDMVAAAKEQTGYGYMRIKRTDLLDTLLKAVAEAGIALHYNKSLISITESADSVTATFSDGASDTANFLLGCDGIHSAVRRLHVDPDQAPVYTGMSGLGALVSASCVSETARQEMRGMNVTMTQEGMFGVMTCTASDDEIQWFLSKEVPLPDSEDARNGWELRRRDEVEGFKSQAHKTLKDAGGEWGDNLRELIGNTTAVKFYPIYKLPTEGRWYKGRTLLLGDAAHAMPPHAGQGVSMAFEDAFLLARLLEKELSLGNAFKQFDDIRRPRVEEIANRSSGNAKMRRKTGPWGLWLKETGLWLFMQGAWTFGMDRWGSETQQMVKLQIRGTLDQAGIKEVCQLGHRLAKIWLR